MYQQKLYPLSDVGHHKIWLHFHRNDIYYYYYYYYFKLPITFTNKSTTNKTLSVVQIFPDVIVLNSNLYERLLVLIIFGSIHFKSDKFEGSHSFSKSHLVG